MVWRQLAIVFLIPLTVTAQPEGFFQQADNVFQQYVTADGEVHYDKLAADPQPLTTLKQQIANANVNAMSGEARKAFYLNAYNILTIHQLVQRYPVSSPKAIEGFFDGIHHQVAGRAMTLDVLEKKRLLQEFPDARLHLAVVCGAKGCPPLWNHAYQPQALDQQLTEQVQRSLADPDFLRMKSQDRMVRVSKIFKWYRSDFLKAAPSVLAFINRYRSKAFPSDTRVRYYSYNWKINGTKTP